MKVWAEAYLGRYAEISCRSDSMTSWTVWRLGIRGRRWRGFIDSTGVDVGVDVEVADIEDVEANFMPPAEAVIYVPNTLNPTCLKRMESLPQQTKDLPSIKTKTATTLFIPIALERFQYSLRVMLCVEATSREPDAWIFIEVIINKVIDSSPHSERVNKKVEGLGTVSLHVVSNSDARPTKLLYVCYC